MFELLNYIDYNNTNLPKFYTSTKHDFVVNDIIFMNNENDYDNYEKSLKIANGDVSGSSIDDLSGFRVVEVGVGWFVIEKDPKGYYPYGNDVNIRGLINNVSYRSDSNNIIQNHKLYSFKSGLLNVKISNSEINDNIVGSKNIRANGYSNVFSDDVIINIVSNSNTYKSTLDDIEHEYLKEVLDNNNEFNINDKYTSDSKSCRIEYIESEGDKFNDVLLYNSTSKSIIKESKLEKCIVGNEYQLVNDVYNIKLEENKIDESLLFNVVGSDNDITVGEINQRNIIKGTVSIDSNILILKDINTYECILFNNFGLIKYYLNNIMINDGGTYNNTEQISLFDYDSVLKQTIDDFYMFEYELDFYMFEYELDFNINQINELMNIELVGNLPKTDIDDYSYDDEIQIYNKEIVFESNEIAKSTITGYCKNNIIRKSTLMGYYMCNKFNAIRTFGYDTIEKYTYNIIDESNIFYNTNDEYTKTLKELVDFQVFTNSYIVGNFILYAGKINHSYVRGVDNEKKIYIMNSILSDTLLDFSFLVMSNLRTNTKAINSKWQYCLIGTGDNKIKVNLEEDLENTKIKYSTYITDEDNLTEDSSNMTYRTTTTIHGRLDDTRKMPLIGRGHGIEDRDYYGLNVNLITTETPNIRDGNSVPYYTYNSLLANKKMDVPTSLISHDNNVEVLMIYQDKIPDDNSEFFTIDNTIDNIPNHFILFKSNTKINELNKKSGYIYGINKNDSPEGTLFVGDNSPDYDNNRYLERYKVDKNFVLETESNDMIHYPTNIEETGLAMFSYNIFDRELNIDDYIINGVDILKNYYDNVNFSVDNLIRTDSQDIDIWKDDIKFIIKKIDIFSDDFNTTINGVDLNPNSINTINAHVKGGGNKIKITINSDLFTNNKYYPNTAIEIEKTVIYRIDNNDTYNYINRYNLFDDSSYGVDSVFDGNYMKGQYNGVYNEVILKNDDGTDFEYIFEQDKKYIVFMDIWLTPFSNPYIVYNNNVESHRYEYFSFYNEGVLGNHDYNDKEYTTILGGHSFKTRIWFILEADYTDYFLAGYKDNNTDYIIVNGNEKIIAVET